MFKCERRVREGDHVSALLFCLYLNDLELYLSARANNGIKINLVSNEINALFKILVFFYADDTVIFEKDNMLRRFLRIL